MSGGIRLDRALVQQGIIMSREKAKAAIISGMVSVNGEIINKPSVLILDDDSITYTGKAERYVGRGGYKLEKALSYFQIDLNNKLCLDIGASTGGFTDCMLQNGAKAVYSIDIGRDQLADKLRSDKRVRVYEQTDIRNLPENVKNAGFEFIAADLSFISLKNVIPYIVDLIGNEDSCVFLIKPQFEAGKTAVGKRGIVKDRKTHISVILNVCGSIMESGFSPIGLTYSPVKGGDGNIEYLLYTVKNSTNNAGIIKADKVVDEAFSDLGCK